MNTEPAPRGRTWQKGTKRRAAVVVLAGLAVLALIAWIFMPAERLRDPVEVYLRQGERAGAAALKRDIEGWAAPGADPGPAVQNLVGLGFSCIAPAGPVGQWNCTRRNPDRERRLTTLEAIIGVQSGVVAQVDTRITVRSMQ